jgi:hypothetical protein
VNEFLKEHGKVEKLEMTVARLQKQIEALYCGATESERTALN